MQVDIEKMQIKIKGMSQGEEFYQTISQWADALSGSINIVVNSGAKKQGHHKKKPDNFE